MALVSSQLTLRIHSTSQKFINQTPTVLCWIQPCLEEANLGNMFCMLGNMFEMTMMLKVNRASQCIIPRVWVIYKHSSPLIWWQSWEFFLNRGTWASKSKLPNTGVWRYFFWYFSKILLLSFSGIHVVQGASKKMSDSDFSLKSVPGVGFYFFRGVLDSEFRARSI